MAKKGARRDPLQGIPYGVNALIRNEGTTIEEVLLSEIDLQDHAYRLRPGRLVELLAESIAASGQLQPVILRYREGDGKWQIISGFRRIEALAKLDRKAVNARLYDAMTDAEAVRQAVVDNFFSGDLTGEHLDTFLERHQREGYLNQDATDFLDWAREKIARVNPHEGAPRTDDLLEDAPQPGAAADTDSLPFNELITRTFGNLSDASQGLERIFLNWSDVSPSDRKILAAECKYIHDIYPFLTR